MQFRSPQYTMRCDTCNDLGSLGTRGWVIEAGLNSDGTVDLVGAKHRCPTCVNRLRVHLLKEDRHYENHMYCGLVDSWFYEAYKVSNNVYRSQASGVLWTEQPNQTTCVTCNATYAKEHNGSPGTEEGSS